MVVAGSKEDLFDVSDSTDWLDTPLASLAPIDASLRCQVCKDFYKTPMITSCSHTFCSLCIRRCLANDGKCPACRTTEQENKLRSNWAIEGLVDDFLKARSALLSQARAQSVRKETCSPKRKLDEEGLSLEISEQSRKKTRTSSRISTKSKEENNVIMLEEDTDDTDDGDSQQNDGQAACPVCNVRMKVHSIDSHLNSCLNEHQDDQSPPSPTRAYIPRDRPVGPPFQKASLKLDRLPQLNYSLFKDVTLRKKLQELGISAQGSRQLLERRHIEWVTLWNANCDASRPRKKVDLLHDLEIWERTQGWRVPFSNNGLNPGSQILHKDFDGAGWAAKHDQSFQDLIVSARKKMVNKGPVKQLGRNSETNNDEMQTSRDSSSIPLLPTPVKNDVDAQPLGNHQSPAIIRQESMIRRKEELATGRGIELIDHQTDTAEAKP